MKPTILITRPNASAKFFQSNDRYWQMKNLDELTRKGCCDNHYYTGYVNRQDALRSIWTGGGEDILRQCRKAGVKLYLLWDEKEVRTVSQDGLPRDCTVLDAGWKACWHASTPAAGNKEFSTMDAYYRQVAEQVSQVIGEDTFIWINIPEAVVQKAGRTADLEDFDGLIGTLTESHPQASLAVTAVSGFGEGRKKKDGLAYSISQSHICFPLFLTDRKAGTELHSSDDLIALAMGQEIPGREYIICRNQQTKTAAVTDGRYKLVKAGKMEALFDLSYDDLEYNNLLEIFIYDRDRDCKMDKRQVYYYPAWQDVPLLRQRLSEILERCR